MTTGSSERAGERRTADVLRRAREVLKSEERGLVVAAETLGPSFAEAVDRLLACRGRIVMAGVGKSGLVGRSLAATFTSTGMPAIFLHPVDALHGDIGGIDSTDVAVLLSTSGETEELIRLVPFLRERGIPTVLITAAGSSSLARSADVVVDVGAAPEASPVKSLPTTSITVATAVGHALAVVAMEARGFREEHFADLHPGGAIGRRFGRRVRDVMHAGDELPLVGEEASLKEALLEIVRGRLGVTGVCEASGRLIGVVTDGDLKRILLSRESVLDLSVREVMSSEPKTIGPDETVVDALRRMEENPGGAITSLFVVAESGDLLGLLHIHDCLKP